MRLLAEQWRLLRGRRDLTITLIGFFALLLVREVATIRGLIDSQPPPSPEALQDFLDQRDRLMMGYAIPANIGTILLADFPILGLMCGFLTCWPLGGEIGSGIVRTALIVNPSRVRYLLSRVLGASILSTIALLTLIVVSLAVPLATGVANRAADAADALASIVPFLGVAMLSVLQIVATAAFVAVLTRSALPAVLGTSALFLAESLFDRLPFLEPVLGLMPQHAALDVLRAVAPAGTVITTSGGTLGSDRDAALAAVVVLGWIVGSLGASVALFRFRDVAE